MKKQIIMAVAVLTVASCAFARDMDSLPSMRAFREHVKEAPAVEAPAAEDAGRQGPESAECVNPDLNGAVIGRGVFQSDFRVSKDGVQVGLLSSEGDGYSLKTAGEKLIAAGVKSEVKGGRKLIVVDCSGSKLGTIVEIDAANYEDGSSYTVYGASDEEIASTGNSTDDVQLVAGGELLGASASQSGFGDKYKVSVSSKVDSRVMAMVTAMQNSAAYRRSSERRRENGPHGHDRN